MQMGAEYGLEILSGERHDSGLSPPVLVAPPHAGNRVAKPLTSILAAASRKLIVRSPCLRGGSILRLLIDHTGLHHKIHALEERDVRKRISGHGHNIRQLAGFDAAGFVLDPQECRRIRCG